MPGWLAAARSKYRGQAIGTSAWDRVPRADSLLAHVVKKYASSQWENIATDSLHYLLGRPGVEDALLRLVAPLGLAPGPLNWNTQVSNPDRSRPDLVGLDEARRPKLLMEVKFWAPLTNNQPNAYLASQEKAFPGRPKDRLLAFLVPKARLHIMKAELRRRVERSVVPSERHSPNVADAEVLMEHRIMVLTWAQVLKAIEAALGAAEDEAQTSGSSGPTSPVIRAFPWP